MIFLFLGGTSVCPEGAGFPLIAVGAGAYANDSQHVFLNEKYDLEECGGGGGAHHFNVRMRVYSKDGVLLGQRNFSVGAEPNTEHVEYLPDRIAYSAALVNDENGVPAVEERVLQFPLTKWDWFEANLDRILFSP